MDKEERILYETIVYSYFVSEGMMPETAKRKVESMTDEQLEKFVS